MARVTAAEYVEDWKRGLVGSTDKIRRGISRVTESPTEKAAKSQERALQNLIQAFTDGTWASQLRKVSLEDWKSSATNKGLQRIAAGVEGASASQVQMAERLLAAVDASLMEVNKTPRGDLEANISRSVTMQRQMAQRKLRRPGSR
jgi:hypothetical protein